MRAIVVFFLLSLVASPAGGREDLGELLAKICRSESGCYSPRDCVAIWQVVRSIKTRRSGDTTAEVLRAVSPSATGAVEPYNDRQRWIQGMHRDSTERPPGWSADYGWDSPFGLECWEDALRTADAVVRGRRPDVIRGVEPVAWGCEPFGPAGSPRCWSDVLKACSRGLARIPGTATRNTFWCRPGSEGCSERRAAECDYLEVAAGP